MLTIFLDSISISAIYDEKHGLVEDLRSRDPTLFKIYRTECKIEQESIKEIPSTRNKNEG